MADYRIVHDRKNCIGCGACAAVCPENWEIKSDGRSALKEAVIHEEDFECNNNAAVGCPVNVIHITNLETNEKII